MCLLQKGLNIMKKLLSLLLCLAMVFGSVTAASAISFNDVKEGSYYYEPVCNIAWFGIIGGFPDGSFKPGSPITRAQMAVMLVNMQDLDPYTPSTPRFTDVATSHWAYKYVEAAAKEGFISGYPDGTFRPDKNVSYDEAITMLIALMGYTLKDLGGTYPSAFTNKARDLGVLNTCSKLGSSAANRADVSCFIRDAILADREDYDVFKYVGPGYKITLGEDGTYTITEGITKKEGYLLTLYVENTSAVPLPIYAGRFSTYINGVLTPCDSSAYSVFPEYKVPSGSIPAGATVRVDLMYTTNQVLSNIDIHPDLAASGDEPVIELLF